MKPDHHSPSSLNLWCVSPAMFVLEKILKRKQPVGAPAHRGSAVEMGISDALMHEGTPLAEGAAEGTALEMYDRLMALSTDKRREEYRETIPAMVQQGVDELIGYGKPSHVQQKVSWHPEGLIAPIIGYLDFHWEDHNITVDLKTTEKIPSAVRIAHARQLSLYVTSNNADARVTYLSPRKRATYQVANVDEHRKALHMIALRCERWLALSDDPDFFVSITSPDLDHYFWGGPARQLAFEIWGI